MHAYGQFSSSCTGKGPWLWAWSLDPGADNAAANSRAFRYEKESRHSRRDTTCVETQMKIWPQNHEASLPHVLLPMLQAASSSLEAAGVKVIFVAYGESDVAR